MAFTECQINLRDSGRVVRTYLSVCITERFGLLIGSMSINRIVTFSICRVRLCSLCGLICLMIWGNVAWAVRRFGRCCVARFVLESHDIFWINCLGRWMRSMGRSTRRRDFGNKRVEHHHGNLVLSCQRCHCWDHGLIIVSVIVSDDARRIQEFAIRAYSTVIRCH